jgi:hypothetical protein
MNMRFRMMWVLPAAAAVIAGASCVHPVSTPPPGRPHVVFAGVRSSIYGIKPFPEPAEWEKAILTMSSYYQGSTPAAVWIVGRIVDHTDCRLEFPGAVTGSANIQFEKVDRHAAYLDQFDRAGIKVFLQVEPANADMKTLIDLVLGRYGKHPCVIGFGVDVEWYREADRPARGVPVDDETGRRWETWVKAHNPGYRLFIKHWNPSWLCPTYRGDIIFVDDGQILPNMEAMVAEFDAWGEFFKPNTVLFQIGYKSDKPWWSQLPQPAKTLGQAIAAKIEQDCGIIWVDFTLKDVLPLR